MRNVDLRNKIWSKTKVGQLEKKFIFDFFFQLNFFVFFKFLNIVCLDQIQKSHIIYKRKLEFFLVKYLHISISVNSYYV